MNDVVLNQHYQQPEQYLSFDTLAGLLFFIQRDADTAAKYNFHRQEIETLVHAVEQFEQKDVWEAVTQLQQPRPMLVRFLEKGPFSRRNPSRHAQHTVDRVHNAVRALFDYWDGLEVADQERFTSLTALAKTEIRNVFGPLGISHIGGHHAAQLIVPRVRKENLPTSASVSDRIAPLEDEDGLPSLEAWRAAAPPEAHHTGSLPVTDPIDAPPDTDFEIRYPHGWAEDERYVPLSRATTARIGEAIAHAPVEARPSFVTALTELQETDLRRVAHASATILADCGKRLQREGLPINPEEHEHLFAGVLANKLGPAKKTIDSALDRIDAVLTDLRHYAPHLADDVADEISARMQHAGVVNVTKRVGALPSYELIEPTFGLGRD